MRQGLKPLADSGFARMNQPYLQKGGEEKKEKRGRMR
jgi:hypothetical protein